MRGADNGAALDGQQRMTAVWRVLNDNYEDGSYFVVVEDFDSEEPQMAAEVIRQSRWAKEATADTRCGATNRKNAWRAR